MMVPSYKYSILRYSPDNFRGESLNIGIVVFLKDELEVRLTSKLDKIKAISGALDMGHIETLAENLKVVDQFSRNSGAGLILERLEQLSRIGPFKFSDPGLFAAENHDVFSDRVSLLLEKLVDPQARPKNPSKRRSRLSNELRSFLVRNRILAQPGENLDSHRMIAKYQLDDGLVADFIIQNGSYHVVEAADISHVNESIKKAISEIAISALILERARMKFGEDKTKSKFLYNATSIAESLAKPSLDAIQHQGVELVNWASGNERSNFIEQLLSIAVPIDSDNKLNFQPAKNSYGKLH